MNFSLKNHWVAILVTTLLTFGASVVFTVTQPMEYRSSFTILAIDQDPNLDGYAAAKSAERLSQSLARTVTTTAFADQVYQQIKDRADLKDNPLISVDIQTRRDEWKKRITAQAFPDVGQVKVSVFQRDRTQAEAIANAVSISLTAYGTDYLGGGKNVALKVVDSVLTSKLPVRPNVFANLAVGLILGFGGSVAFLLLFAPAAAVPTMYVPMAQTMLPMQPIMSPSTMAEKPVMEVPVRHRPHSVPPVMPAMSHPAPVSTPVTPVAPPVTHPHQADGPKAPSPANLPVIDEIVMP